MNYRENLSRLMIVLEKQWEICQYFAGTTGKVRGAVNFVLEELSEFLLRKILGIKLLYYI